MHESFGKNLWRRENVGLPQIAVVASLPLSYMAGIGAISLTSILPSFAMCGQALAI